jgi:hypothetical protein
MGDNIIDFKSRRSARQQPDPRFVEYDDNRRGMLHYKLSYFMDGKEWAVEIWAYSWEDAEARVGAMHNSLCLRGQMRK